MKRRTFLSGLLGTALTACPAPFRSPSEPAVPPGMSIAAVGGAGRHLANALLLTTGRHLLVDSEEHSTPAGFLDFHLDLPSGYRDLPGTDVQKVIETSAGRFIDDIAAPLPSPLMLAGGLGGCVGSFAMPFLARELANRGLTVIAAIFLPFAFEGEQRRELANRALARLTASCLSVNVVDNEWTARLPQSTEVSAWFDTANRLQVAYVASLASSGAVTLHAS